MGTQPSSSASRCVSLPSGVEIGGYDSTASPEATSRLNMAEAKEDHLPTERPMKGPHKLRRAASPLLSTLI